MPTTTGGIEYPSSSDAPRVWEDMQALAESVQAALNAMGTWTTFTPTFTAGIAAVGTGASREAWYCQIGKIVHWGGRVEFGTGASIVTTVQIDLPVPAFPGGGLGLQAAVGSWNYRDTSANEHYAGTMGVFGNTGASATLSGAWTGTAPSTRVNGTAPFAVGAQDVLSWTGTYRAA